MLRHRPASQVSSLIFLSPAVTAILAYLIVGQSRGWLTIAGLVVSGAGVSLTTRAPAARGHGDQEATREAGSRVMASRARAAAGASR
jgi:drug/metabolite transporter (DMT)-like permease